MIKSLFLSLLAASSVSAHPGGKDKKAPRPPAAVVNTCNNTCLTLQVRDFYGDGWDGVELHAEMEGGSAMSLSPDCTNNRLSTQICPDADGTFYFTAVHSNSSYIPENYWEVFWTATAHNCDGSVASMYTGGFNSSLIMDYAGNSWMAQYWENLWDNQKSCDSCGDAKRCKPKKPKKKSKAKKPSSGKPIKNDNTKNTTKVPKPKPRYGPPAVDLRVTMYDEVGNGWWMNDYSGDAWYLADDRREKLFHSGTLCDGSQGYCNLCLGDGSYTMRFTGDASNFTAWDFCGVTGQHAQELTFHVKKGKCIADSVVSLATDCAGSVASTVTLTGVVAISGFPSEVVSSNSYSVVAKTLATMVPGWSADKINIVSTSLDSRSVESSRRLSDFTQDFTFEVSFIAEESFGIDGRSYANVVSLASTISNSLSTKMLSGQFEAALQLEIALNNVVSLGATSAAELLSLEISSVVYMGAQEMTLSMLPSVIQYSDDSYLSISKYNVESLVVFCGVALAGFVAFVGVVRQAMAPRNVYEELAEDSVRDESVHADVGASEMETSNSPMVNTAFQIDSDPTTSLKL